MACRDLIWVALVIVAAFASTPDDIVTEGLEEHAAVQAPLQIESASDIEKVILKLQAGNPDRVVTLPTSLLGVGWKERLGKEFIYGNAPLHVGARYLCWDVPDGRGDGKIIGTKCAPRTANNRVRAALAGHGGRHHIQAVAKYLSSKFGKMTPLQKREVKAEAKKAADHAETKTAKKVTKKKHAKSIKKAMSVQIRCKRAACARKAKRLAKAQERNGKFTVSEKKAKAEMKEAKRDKAEHAKTMEVHKKKHAKIRLKFKKKTERFGKAKAKTQQLSEKELRAKKEMDQAKKARDKHAEAMEAHEKRAAILKKLAQKKQARVKMAQEKARKLTAREATIKKEVRKAYVSAKKAKNHVGFDVEEVSD